MAGYLLRGVNVVHRILGQLLSAGLVLPDLKRRRPLGRVSIVLIALGTIMTGAMSAHGDFGNGGFETGTYANWTKTPYRNNGISVFPPLSIADLGLSVPADTTDLSSIVTGSAGTLQDDLMTGSTPAATLRVPKTLNNSARVNLTNTDIARTQVLLGHTAHGQRASSAKQRVTVTSGEVNPSDGKVHLRFVVAPVLDNPGGSHTNVQQPYFAVELRKVVSMSDSTPVPVPGAPASSPGQIFFTFNF